MSRLKKLSWLIPMIFLLLLIISVGGITRLTRSGLSITQWKPVTGIIPPLSQEDWEEEFELYQASPEFNKVNSHFAIDDYKNIFWWEYLHRLLGRVIFLFSLCLVYVFWRAKAVSLRYALALPSIIAFQGLIGWLMVKSGLNDRPSVSHFMLAVHYVLALSTTVLVYFQIAKIKPRIMVSLSRTSKLYIYGFGGLLGVQILYGCFVSGLKAGLYFDTFPLMGGKIIPDGFLVYSNFVGNFLNNPIAVQWIHRWLGISVLMSLVFLGSHLLKSYGSAFFRPLLHLVSIVVVQVVIGISLLLFRVPISLAVFHQFFAILVVLGYFNIVFRSFNVYLERNRVSQ